MKDNKDLLEEKLLKDFGKHIRRLRQNLGISQEELSFRSGLHRNYISDSERGQRNLSLKALNSLAKGLGVEIQNLLDLNNLN